MEDDWKDSREEYPKTPGNYLIYGDPHIQEGRSSYIPAFRVLRVFQASDHLAYVVGGSFWYPYNRAYSYFKWRPLNVDPPEL